MKYAYVALLLSMLAVSPVLGEDPATPEAATRPQPRIAVEQVVHGVDYRRRVPESLTLTLRVVLDPESGYGFLSESAQVDKALDEKGRSLMPAGGEADARAPHIRPMMNVASVLVRVELKPRPPEEERTSTIKVIEGSIPAQLITKVDKVELEGEGSTTREYAGGVKFSLSVTKADAANWKVESSIDLPSTLTAEERQAWQGRVNGLQPRITDASGKSAWLPGGGSSSSGSTRITQSQNYRRRDANDTSPPKVSFDVVEETKPVEIPFRLENVPLP